jgi:hypothetical protein
VTVTGSGFPANSPLAAELRSDPVQLGTTVADASGRFRIVVTIPLGTAPGLHTIRVREVNGIAFADASVLVTAPAVAGAQVIQGGVQQARALSRTGGDFTRRAELALVLMAAGFGLVALAWNDRRPVGLAGRRSPWPGRRRWP